MLFNIEINDQAVSAKRGETILTVLQRNGIKVPTLCNMSSFSPTGACRMCIVEVDGIPGLVPACSHTIEEWMKIRTHSPRVMKARKTIVELLLASHPDDCLYCERSGSCELQSLATELNIRERKYHGRPSTLQIDKACASIERDPAKCILCGRCMRVCDEMIGVSAIDVIGRGSNSRIGTTYNKGLNSHTCLKCGQCIMVCPTGALAEKSHLHKVMEAVNNPLLHTVIQFSPTVPASIAEDLGIKANKDIINLLRAALKEIGFRQVFDTAFAADINIMEVAAELMNRLNKKERLPLFTSCCPSWVKYIEDIRPGFTGNLSTTQSPQLIMGNVIKDYIASSAGHTPDKVFVVSVMPCTAKKDEARRGLMKDGVSHSVDAVLTTRELVKLFRLHGIDFNNIEPEPTDTAFNMCSSAGKLFGISGGVSEGILRTLHFMMTGQEISPLKIADLRGLKGKKETKIKIGKQTIGVVAISDLSNIKTLLAEIESGRDDIHLVEVMACPNGCINGGGQRIASDEKSLKSRMKALYDQDEEEMIKVAHKNIIVAEIYDKFLGKPDSEKNMDLLHTTHTKQQDT